MVVSQLRRSSAECCLNVVVLPTDGAVGCRNSNSTEVDEGEQIQTAGSGIENENTYRRIEALRLRHLFDTELAVAQDG